MSDKEIWEIINAPGKTDLKALQKALEKTGDDDD